MLVSPTGFPLYNVFLNVKGRFFSLPPPPLGLMQVLVEGTQWESPRRRGGNSKKPAAELVKPRGR